MSPQTIFKYPIITTCLNCVNLVQISFILASIFRINDGPARHPFPHAKSRTTYTRPGHFPNYNDALWAYNINDPTLKVNEHISKAIYHSISTNREFGFIVCASKLGSNYKQSDYNVYDFADLKLESH